MLRKSGASSIPEASRLITIASGILDCPVKPGDDSDGWCREFCVSFVMAYAATANDTFAPAPAAAPGVLALQRALVWLVGASGAIVFIEPSPYELTTLLSAVLFFATGARLRLTIMPLLLLIVSLNVGYSIGAIPLYGESDVFSWIMTSWYMAFTVIFLAVV